MTGDNPIIYYSFRTESSTEESDLLIDGLELGLEEKGFSGRHQFGGKDLSYGGIAVKVLEHGEMGKGRSAKDIQVLFREPRTLKELNKRYKTAEETIDFIKGELQSSPQVEFKGRYVNSYNVLKRRLN